MVSHTEERLSFGLRLAEYVRTADATIDLSFELSLRKHFKENKPFM